ncbi:AraC family transcriptional regulator [Paenibacillus elgii]|uniref:AraC family transcriptional regulator n=1 Tax=Paenibacillus elgii TaxID=189691 RepID=UPI000248CB74|nr:AraC family transcriptional regulator [Paenibacillus elgii]
MYKDSIREAIRYIEANLKQPIRVEQVASIVHFSYYHFHRIFYATTGETIGDYIRKRRLTEAAIELLSSDKPILDIAVDYNFESQEAFTRSFKNVFGIPPHRFRKIGLGPVASDKPVLRGGRLVHRFANISIEPEIVQIDKEIHVIGLKRSTSLHNNQIPELWKELLNRRRELEQAGVNVKGIAYGICMAAELTNGFQWTEYTTFVEMAGFEVDHTGVVPPSMSAHVIQPGRYAVFKHRGAVNLLRNSYDYIWGTWLPNSSFEIDFRDDFEQYGQDFYGPDRDESVIRIHIPIK